MSSPIFKNNRPFLSNVNFALIAVLTCCSFFLSQGGAFGQCTPGSVTYSAAGPGTFVVPDGVFSIKVQVWGAGGRGSSIPANKNRNGGGGGGGGSSESTLSVSPGQSYNYSVGTGSSTTSPGGDSWFAPTNVADALVLAKGGESVDNDKDGGANGGSDTDGIGDFTFSGGKGGKGKDGQGGGGGSSASPTNDGNNGLDGDKGATGGVANGVGGNGGDGGAIAGSNGMNGFAPGGGGGGAVGNNSNSWTGGRGGDGQITITWECASCGDTLIFDTAGGYSFTIPDGVDSIRVQVWGAGGRGSRITTNNFNGGGGGGGGAYSELTLDSFEGDLLAITVGQGASGTSNGGTSFVTRDSNLPLDSAFIVALGGTSVGNNIRPAGTGAAIYSYTGSPSTFSGRIEFAGGNGSVGTSANGGGGGSSASPSAAGDNATGRNQGTITDGGDGGRGGNDGNGENASNPGGGGGGGDANDNTDRTGGNGGNGLVIITLICETPPDIDLNGCDGFAEVVDVLDGGGTTEEPLDRIIIQINAACDWTVPAEVAEDQGLDILVLGGGGGGGAQAGGGGGAGGLLQVSIPDLTVASITPGTTIFNISAVGAGGAGSKNPKVKGGNGGSTTITHYDNNSNTGTLVFSASTGGGGGGGSEEDDLSRLGNNGLPNSGPILPVGYSSSINIGGSGGGAGHARDGNTIQGGTGAGAGTIGGSSIIIGGNDTHAGGGGGGSNALGTSTVGEEQGGDGGDGVNIAIFGDRFYSAGGGGGGRTSAGLGGIGGSSDSGGRGGHDNTLALSGQTPGSGGGGADHNKNSGGNGAGGAVIISYLQPRILPVEFLYFNASYNLTERSAGLSWATAKERDNSHFEIERAENSIKSWTKVGEIEGAGNSDSPQEYSFKDSSLPSAGGIIYYRIKQVDFDGDLIYSRTRAIQLDPLPSYLYWRVYPNPTTGNKFTIEIADPSKYKDEPINIRMISLSGQTKLIPIMDIRTMGDQVSQWFETQANGVYILEITWGAFREQHKVIFRR